MQEFLFNELNTLIEIIQNASKISLNLQESSLQVEKKIDNSLVTNVDLMINFFLQEEIKKNFGEINFVSEENSDHENTLSKQTGNYFLIDPIDGTSSYIEKKDFSINLSYIENNKTILSIVALPKQNIILFNNYNDVYRIDNDKLSEVKKLRKYSLNMNNFSISIGTNTAKDESFIKKLNEFYQMKNLTTSINISTASVKFFNFLEKDDLLCLSYNNIKDWDILPFILFFDLVNIKYYYGKKYFFASKDEELLKDILKFFINE